MRTPRFMDRWTLISEDGGPIVSFSTFMSLEVRADATCVSAPVEEGTFIAYDKTITPTEIEVSLGVDGTAQDMQGVLDRLDELQQGTQLLSLITPDKEYKSLNLESYSYKKTADQGASALFVDLSLIEIIQVQQQFTNARLAPRKKRGKVQTERSALSGIIEFFS